MLEILVSAIVCTRNRSNGLSRCLKALSEIEQGGKPFELVVVDNGSTDDTKSIVDTFKECAPFLVHYIFEPRRGLSFARNAGLEAASGQILIFTDDDCYVSTDWVAATRLSFADGEEKIVGGRVNLFNKEHLPVTIKTDLSPSRLKLGTDIFGFIHGANFAITKSAAEKIGLFDTRFGAGSKLVAAEDTDFFYRGFIRGIAINYDPTIVVDHDHGRSTQREKRALEFGYHVGMGAMATKFLLIGQMDLFKAIYWKACAEIRQAGADRRYVLMSKAMVGKGALLFLAQAKQPGA